MYLSKAFLQQPSVGLYHFSSIDPLKLKVDIFSLTMVEETSELDATEQAVRFPPLFCAVTCMIGSCFYVLLKDPGPSSET